MDRKPLTEDRARAIAAHLASTHPDRATHRWLPRPTAGGWEVVRVGLSPPTDALQAEQRADERPMTGEDPRSSAARNIGGSHIGG